MIPARLAERLNEMGHDAEKIYATKTKKAGLVGIQPVPWMKGFFFLDSKDGQEFLMDAASFVPVIALRPKPNERIWDMAAAPGMKTVLMARLMENKGSIVATEVSRTRILRLKNNIRKFGCEICCPVRCDASIFKSDHLFDKILLDAPCSGEGMITKQKKLFGVWSEKRILRMQKIQKKLIKRGFELLREGGVLVYSTCTFAPEENEEVVEWLAENFKAKAEKIEVPGLIHSNGIEIWRGKKFNNYDKYIRIWPYQNNTNGMFVAKLRKQPVKS